jgi:hypothetical protein
MENPRRQKYSSACVGVPEAANCRSGVALLMLCKMVSPRLTPDQTLMLLRLSLALTPGLCSILVFTEAPCPIQR